jgi:hypothetical protein
VAELPEPPVAPEEAWRYEKFRSLGFAAAEAMRLAAWNADWHAAERLIGQGCPTAIATDLLEPMP